LADAVPQITRTLLQSHNGLQDFRVDTNEETLNEFRKTESAFTLSLGGVAAISLFVGGIGIMNVMLASINERIREIGVRKSVGARASDIFLQFLAEAAVIASVGGLIGLVVSAILLAVMNFILSAVVPGGVAAALSPWVMFGGFASSVTIGLLAGVYPAVRAARLDPIEALRHE
jgi:ABC-type antimicrobial peptide transport system permease subunit